MAEKRKKSKKSQKAVWERGYNGHVLWQGKQKLGKVSVHAGKKAPHKYTWEAGKRVGVADSLARARKDVEYAALIADKQRDLFEP